MLRSRTSAVAWMAAALFSFALAGCGGDTTEQPPPEPDQTGRVPPAEPAGAGPGNGTGYVFATNKLFLGESDRTGAASDEAWKEFGYNLDGKISDATSTDLCKPVGTATASSVYTDGNEGIDNSFGKNILQIITSLVASPSAEVNTSIADGSFTVMVEIDNLGADPSYTGLPARLLIGSQLVDAAGMDLAPTWDGNDEWPLVQEFLNDPTDPKSSKVQFPNSYLVENTWVSNASGSLNLSVSVAGYSLNLPIVNAILTMDINPDRSGAMNGTIAGILPTEQLITELQKVIGAFEPSLCSGGTAESIFNQIRQASDIMADGTQNPSAECNGISLGIGFEALPVKVGPISAPAMPAPDPCAMAPAGG